MSPDEQPFLDAILARPTDDAPRLVYADFLADTGSPADGARSDLVRVQLALARLPDDHPRRAELNDRQTGLLQRFLPEWSAHLRGLAAGVDFRRGLPIRRVGNAMAGLSEPRGEPFSTDALGFGGRRSRATSDAFGSERPDFRETIIGRPGWSGGRGA